MKRVFTTVLGLALAAQAALAGGIVTNTNQSASFTRMPAQDATTGIHAVYFNPAGLTKLNDGFHLQVGNQFITQQRTVDSSFPTLNESRYHGDVMAPLFPTLYAAYKTGDWAVSFGFNPIGGGGGATYPKGLPSFEQLYSTIPAGLSAAGIPTTDYSADIYFKGSSTYLGFQLGVSYKISDMISVFAGARYVMVDNTYQGHLRNVRINPYMPQAGVNGSMIPASKFFTDFSQFLLGASAQAQGAATSATNAAAGLAPLVQGAGPLTLAQAEAMGIISATQRATIAGGLVQMGVPGLTVDNMSFIQLQNAYNERAAYFTAQSQALAAQAPVMQARAAATADAEVESEQKGSGFTPIVGVHLSFMEDKVNIGIKYEHQTQMVVKNKTAKDVAASPLFPDGLEVPNDMPGLLSIGTSFQATEKLSASAGFHYYFDKAAKYGKKIGADFVTNDKVLESNSYEVALGLEYALADMVTVSGGWLVTQNSPMDVYQSDLSHALNTHTFSLGANMKVNSKMSVDAGVMYTVYGHRDKAFTTPMPYTETYHKATATVGIGLNYSFGSAE